MLDSWIKAFRKLFGLNGNEVPTKASQPGTSEQGDSNPPLKRKHKKSKSKSKESDYAEASSDSTDKKKNKKDGKSRKSKHSGKKKPTDNVASVAPSKPEKPATLREVAVMEGKVRFLDLPLHEDVQFGVQYVGFEYCTPIQAMALPALLEGRDLAGKAQTGTGKTAAFLLAIFTHILSHPKERKPGCPRALVLAPTRELAMQIQKDAEALEVFTDLTSVVVFGGMDHEKQRRNVEQLVDIVIGTPGRIIDYARSGSLKLSRVEVLVIDEADRMLDMGFIPDVKRIVSQLPKKGERQTLLFSATLDEDILRLASGWLAEPVIVESEPEKLVSEKIEQTFYSVLRSEKLALLLYILRTEPYDRMLIFGNRKDVNLRLQSDLAQYGYQVPVLSGDIAQEKRIKILEKFRNGEEKIVIATDVAARGIHVDDVSLVVNYDLPERAEDYVHRIGRTGRAGHNGKSISFLCEYGAYYLPDIEKLLDTQFSSVLPSEEMVRLPEPVPRKTLSKPGANRKSTDPDQGSKASTPS